MISAKNVMMEFDGFAALKDLSCEIPDGVIYGLVGSNGAGKSTFLRLLSGVYRPKSGEITADGKKLYENPEVKKDILYVPDELYFLPQASMNTMANFYAAAYENFKVGKNLRKPFGQRKQQECRMRAILVQSAGKNYPTFISGFALRAKSFCVHSVYRYFRVFGTYFIAFAKIMPQVLADRQGNISPPRQTFKIP